MPARMTSRPRWARHLLACLLPLCFLLFSCAQPAPPMQVTLIGHPLTHSYLADPAIGHGHFSRSILSRWVELPVSEGVRFSMAAASIAVCGYEKGIRQISALGLTGHTNPCLPPA